MIECGTQCMICDFPIHLDTYIGCAHDCKYCFAREKQSIKTVRPLDNADALRRFIEGHRTNETRWCDWKIPVHWGSSSDPFQQAELEYRRSREVLEIFAETGYPFIVSTKNPVLAVTEYADLLARCRCVFQISMAAPEYDKLEPGAPTYEERLEAAAALSKVCTRVIARVQPYFTDQYRNVLREIPRYKQAGIYGIIVEGYATRKKQKGLVKDGKYGFPVEVLAPQFKQIRERAHQNGLRFFCGEDMLRFLGDSMSCCGTEGLDDFRPNTYNVEHLAHDDPAPEPTEVMKQTENTRPFRSLCQTNAWAKQVRNSTFADLMQQIGGPWVERYRDLRAKYGG